MKSWQKIIEPSTLSTQWSLDNEHECHDNGKEFPKKGKEFWLRSLASPGRSSRGSVVRHCVNVEGSFCDRWRCIMHISQIDPQVEYDGLTPEFIRVPSCHWLNKKQDRHSGSSSFENPMNKYGKALRYK
jgi:hypothetical protein